MAGIWLLTVPRGLGFVLAHGLGGKSHRSCSARVPTAASWSPDLPDTGAEPEEILRSPKGSGPCSRTPGGCSGHPWRFPRLARGWDQSARLHSSENGLCGGHGSNRPAALGFFGAHVRCLSCLLNAALNPGANPQLQNRIWPLGSLFFFFPLFL